MLMQYDGTQWRGVSCLATTFVSASAPDRPMDDDVPVLEYTAAMAVLGRLGRLDRLSGHYHAR